MRQSTPAASQAISLETEGHATHRERRRASGGARTQVEELLPQEEVLVQTVD